MSFEIFYGKQFIKLSENEFVPMVIAGSNNCYEHVNGRERRERSWWNFTSFLKGSQFGSLEEMLKNVEEHRESLKNSSEEYDDKSFGYFASCAIAGKHTSGTTYGMFKGIFIDGCKKAKTVEELNEEGFYVCVKTGYDYKNEIDYKSISVSNSEELKSAIIELEEFTKSTSVGFCISFSKNIDRFFSDRIRENKIKKQNSQSEKEKKEVSEYFVFSYSNGYFVKGTKRGFKYNYTADGWGVKRVYSEKAAQSFCKRLNEKYNQHFEVEKVELKESILV